MLVHIKVQSTDGKRTTPISAKSLKSGLNIAIKLIESGAVRNIQKVQKIMLGDFEIATNDNGTLKVLYDNIKNFGARGTKKAKNKKSKASGNLQCDKSNV